MNTRIVQPSVYKYVGRVNELLMNSRLWLCGFDRNILSVNYLFIDSVDGGVGASRL